MTLPILSGAVTRTSSVWPARKRERERLIDRRTFTRPPAGAVTVLRLTGQRRPGARNSTHRPRARLALAGAGGPGAAQFALRPRAGVGDQQPVDAHARAGDVPVGRDV